MEHALSSAHDSNYSPLFIQFQASADPNSVFESVQTLDQMRVNWSTPPTHTYYFSNAPAPAIHFSSKAELLIVNAWSWGVKASTGSDPLGVLPAACARKNVIVVICKNQNRKNRNRLPEIENRTEFGKCKPTQPYRVV